MERPELPGSSGEVPGRGLESSTAAAEEFQNPQVSPILRPRQQADCSSGAPTDTLEPHICSPLVCLHLLKGLCHLFHSLPGRTEGPLLLRSVKAEVRGTARRWLGLGQGLRAGRVKGAGHSFPWGAVPPTDAQHPIQKSRKKAIEYYIRQAWRHICWN